METRVLTNDATSRSRMSEYLMSSISSANHLSLGKESFASTYLGQQMLEKFVGQLREAVLEAKEYGEPVPTYEQIDQAILEATRVWTRIPEPTVLPSINSEGNIILTVISVKSGRHSFVVK